MCRVGDIIVVKEYKSQNSVLRRHSFVVLDIEGGKISGMDYDMVCNVMSSFHSEEHRKKKLKFPGNFEYSSNQENVKNGHGKDLYIKADQLYYFDSSTIEYYVIGNITPELFNQLIEFIEKLENIEHITDNLS